MFSCTVQFITYLFIYLLNVLVFVYVFICVCVIMAKTSMEVRRYPVYVHPMDPVNHIDLPRNPIGL